MNMENLVYDLAAVIERHDLQDVDAHAKKLLQKVQLLHKISNIPSAVSDTPDADFIEQIRQANYHQMTG